MITKLSINTEMRNDPTVVMKMTTTVKSERPMLVTSSFGGGDVDNGRAGDSK